MGLPGCHARATERAMRISCIILSSFANAYIRTVTGLRVRDCTGGYRCWRREALARLPLERIVSEGY